MTKARRVALLLASSVLTAACVAGSTIPSSPASVVSPPGATSAGTAAATPVTTPPVLPSTRSSATPAPAPRAEIVTADATVVGTLGTYTIDDSGSDSPWLPFDSLPSLGLGAAEAPVIRFVDGVEIGQFQAEIAAAADTAGTAVRGVPGGTLGPDRRSFTIGPLPPGRWVLEARVFRADGRGDGLTFWAVTVP